LFYYVGNNEHYLKGVHYSRQFFVLGIIWSNTTIILCLSRNDGAVRFTGNIREAYHKVNAAISLKRRKQTAVSFL